MIMSGLVHHNELEPDPFLGPVLVVLAVVVVVAVVVVGLAGLVGNL